MPLNNGAAKQKHGGSQEANKRSARAGKSSGAGQRHKRKHQRKQKRRELWNAMWETHKQKDRIQAVQICGGSQGWGKTFSEQGKNAKAAGKYQESAVPLTLLSSAPGRNTKAQKRTEQSQDRQVGAEKLNGLSPWAPHGWVGEVTYVSAYWLRVTGNQGDQPQVSDSAANADAQTNPEAALSLHFLSLQVGDLLAP